MHVIDRYKKAVQIANAETHDTFGVYGPYEPGTDIHSFWLSVFDRAFA